PLDMFTVYAIALSCLLSVSLSSPSCEDLIRPMDHLDVHNLEGRRALVAGSLSDKEYIETFKSRDSAVIDFDNSTDPSKISFKRAFNFNGTCSSLNTDVTLEGSGFTLPKLNFTITFYHTACQDCLLSVFNNKDTNHQRLYLFSKRRQVEPKEMDDFTAQAQCLKMTAPVLMDPTKELCPESSAEDKTEEKMEA
uniref:Apolipoprotein M n=1 Tax=Gouania willdenowi TaxID=441366 RepID=A0A8C5G880_GOUWI